MVQTIGGNDRHVQSRSYVSSYSVALKNLLARAHVKET